jgi:hypothetical protein
MCGIEDVKFRCLGTLLWRCTSYIRTNILFTERKDSTEAFHCICTSA